MPAYVSRPDLAPTIAALLASRQMPPIGARAHDLCLGAVRNHRRGVAIADRFDDVMFVAVREEAAGAPRLLLSRCTVDPGLKAHEAPTHPRGVWHMAPGRHPLIWTPGLHKQDPERPALVQVPGVRIPGFRDLDADNLMEDLLAADDVQGANLHGGMDWQRPTQSVGRWSEGCWVTSQAFVAVILMLVEAQARAGMGRKVSAHLLDVSQDPVVDGRPLSAPLFDAVGVAIAA